MEIFHNEKTENKQFNSIFKQVYFYYRNMCEYNKFYIG